MYSTFFLYITKFILIDWTRSILLVYIHYFRNIFSSCLYHLPKFSPYHCNTVYTNYNLSYSAIIIFLAGLDLKVAAKFFGTRFACGSSVTGDDEIVVQGDIKDDLIDLIPEKWPEVTPYLCCYCNVPFSHYWSEKHFKLHSYSYAYLLVLNLVCLSST